MLENCPCCGREFDTSFSAECPYCQAGYGRPNETASTPTAVEPRTKPKGFMVAWMTASVVIRVAAAVAVLTIVGLFLLLGASPEKVPGKYVNEKYGFTLSYPETLHDDVVRPTAQAGTMKAEILARLVDKKDPLQPTESLVILVVQDEDHWAFFDAAARIVYKNRTTGAAFTSGTVSGCPAVFCTAMREGKVTQVCWFMYKGKAFLCESSSRSGTLPFKEIIGSIRFK